MIEVNTLRNRPKDGKNVIAVVCDDEDFKLLLSDITFNRECMVRPRNRKPVDAATSAGSESIIEKTTVLNESGSQCEVTSTISRKAMIKVKGMAKKSTASGTAVRWLIEGRTVASRDSRFSYLYITDLRSQLREIVGFEVIGATTIKDRKGRKRKGYYLLNPSLFKAGGSKSERPAH